MLFSTVVIRKKKGLGKTQTIAGFIEAVVRVAVACKDDDLVAAFLQADGRVDDETLCAADAEVGVQEDDRLLLGFVLLLC